VGNRLKIASWNINSVRARTAIVERLIAEQQPDILCLQETKVLDSIFPADLFRKHGYVHQQLNGQRMHHGVAILSRVPLKDPGKHDWQDNGVRGLVRLYELDGVFGIAALAARRKVDELSLTRAYTKLGEALGLDWAQQQVARFVPADQWERLLTAGLARDFEQLRIEFLSRTHGKDPDAGVEEWIAEQRARIDQFRKLVARARAEGQVSAPMLAQIAGQARILLAR
jgi:hypothetical protein